MDGFWRLPYEGGILTIAVMLFDDMDDAPEPPSEPPPAAQGLRPPRANPHLFGHAGPESGLVQSFREGRVPHGMVFAGPEGIGKATLAYRFTRFLMAAPEAPEDLAVDPQSQAFRLVASGGHPDVLDIGLAEGEASIGVEAIRPITPFLRKTPAMGGWRVVIVDDADKLTRNAQNALLKNLEEPPPSAVLILVSARPGLFLPTIRSRTRRVNLAPLGPDDMARVVELAGHRNIPEAVLQGAQGAPGMALAWLSEDCADIAQAAEDVVARAGTGAPPWTEWHHLSERLHRAENTVFTCFARTLQQLLNKRIYKAAGEGETGVMRERLALADRIAHALQRQEAANLDRRSTLLLVFEDLHKGLKDTG